MKSHGGHYVYEVYVDDVVRYIGSGKGDRYLHGNSGRSSCIELNKDYFEGKVITVSIVKDGITKAKSLQLEKTLIESHPKGALYNRFRYKVSLNRSSKFNKINSDEIRRVIEHWYSNGRCSVTKSLRKVYKSSLNSESKDTNWVTDIGSKTYFNNEFKRAVDSITIKSFVRLRNSAIFSYGDHNAPLTTRIRQMDIAAKFEEELEKKEAEIEMLKAKLEMALSIKDNWETIAISHKDKGFTQKEISEIVGKSVSTIKRLFKEKL
jgi:hypothetical protein